MLEGLTPPPKNAGSCKVATITETMTDSDKQILLDAVDNPKWQLKTLSKALGERGVQISDSPLTNHRQKTCACYRLK